MLQREVQPGHVPDPNVVTCSSPCTFIDATREYYLDPERFLFFRSVPMWADIRGGLLCDDSGTGKTAVCLALILSTLNQLPTPPKVPHTSAITSDLARTFPDLAYRGDDPDAVAPRRLVTAAFGAPSPGERLSRRPRPAAVATDAAGQASSREVPRPNAELKRNNKSRQLPVEPPVSLAHISAHRLRATHSCGPALLEQLPLPVQKLLGPISAPYVQVWPSTTRTIRTHAISTPLRVYISAATLILVPSMLMAQWCKEIQKHCVPGALRVLVVGDAQVSLPPAADLAQNYDIVLLSHFRLGQDEEESPHRADIPSPWLQVYWKRIIVDEGQVLAGDSAMARLCSRLRVERRWLVSSTPAPGMSTSVNTLRKLPASPVANVPHNPASLSEASNNEPRLGVWSAAERRTLEALRSVVVRFLCISPWHMMPSDTHDTALCAKEPDWHTLMIKEDSAKRRWWELLSRILIRHQSAVTEQETPRPPLECRTVVVQGTCLEHVTYQVLVALIRLNAALTGKQGSNYYFGTSQKRTLATVMDNVAHACFHFAPAGLLHQVRSALDHGRGRYSLSHGMSERDCECVSSALQVLHDASEHNEWHKHLAKGSLQFAVAYAGDAVSANSGANVQDMSLSELLALTHDYTRKQERRKDQASVKRRATDIRTPASTLHLQNSSSSKLNVVIQYILAVAAHEKVVVVSAMDDVLQAIAQVLLLSRVTHLTCLSSMPPKLRMEQIHAYTAQNASYRCLLLSASAGGSGLDLHDATQLLFVEPLWHKEWENLAIRRLWQTGKTHRVTVTTYVMHNTHEMQLQDLRSTSAEIDTTMEAAKTMADDPTMKRLMSQLPLRPVQDIPVTQPVWDIDLKVPNETLLQSRGRAGIETRKRARRGG